MSSTISQLASQWANPRDITTILMIIGGDVVQKALAQTTGCWYTPVCFSFGWVAYSFMALISVIGDGRLLPAPDYPVKVFNLRTGYVRENKNWVIGRLLRDQEAYMSRKEPAPNRGIRITIWEAKDNVHRQSKVSFLYSRIHVWGLITAAVQFGIATIPLILDQKWGILLITGFGTLMALLAGGLPQWRVEKLPNRQRSEKIFALTTGIGSKDIMVILGAGKCLDLEDLSAQETPRSGRPWMKFQPDTSKYPDQDAWVGTGAKECFLFGHTGPFHFLRMKYHGMLARTFREIPGGFFVTMVVCVAQSFLWLLFLITVAALGTNTWYLILIGSIGMFQNGYVAAMERKPEHRNCFLEYKEVITTLKVMDGLMDFQTIYGTEILSSKDVSEPFIMPLVKEFFPGRLLPDEEDWWNGEQFNYDELRSEKKGTRGFPRSALLPQGSQARRQILKRTKSPSRRKDDVAREVPIDTSHGDMKPKRDVQSRLSMSATEFKISQLERAP